MSRIGKMPIEVPAGSDVVVGDGNLVTVKGPKGTLTEKLHNRMTIKKENNIITIERPTDEIEDRSIHGLTRTLLNNMIVGVTEGYQKQLEIVGVGYRAVKTGKTLTLTVGYSHTITFEEKNDITFDVPTPNIIIIKGISKQGVGQIAAQIREKRPPEPYLGKGIKYSNERIRRKAGKAGK
ncbi:MAG: 50S ribosomal protein L6 [Eubacteriales bacterium]|jgi:large subunit ribosomal protein L6|nr:50S ribosomal protein L6 [Eubacteriales bacterium]